MAKSQNLNCGFIRFKESFFRVKKSRPDSFIETLQNIRPDSSIIKFYKIKQFGDIVNRELGFCPREKKILDVEGVTERY